MIRATPLVGGVSLAALCAALLWSAPSQAESFRRPVACTDCIANWYYFDQLSGAGIRDWHCQSSTYDGHRGSDFSLLGNNPAIDAGHDVVAAADGAVVSSEDGHYDRCTACSGAGCGTSYGWGYGNHVVINHGSYRVIYAHLRQGSVRVSSGDLVTCGQTIGQIGSSGCSTGAHLHFEVRPRDGSSATAFDPFQGSCSPTSPSLWIDQGPHRGMPSDSCGGPPPPTCPPGTYPIWTCVDGGTARRRCVDGDDQRETCRWGCISNPVGTDDLCADPPDVDGDGFTADVDCDDNDPTIYPGAPEICGDGIDQSCDGTDLECPPEPPDADGDGFTADIDCDDDDPTIYPGAPEICGDGIDQSCDGYDEPCPEDDAGADVDPDVPDQDGGMGRPGLDWERPPGLRGGCVSGGPVAASRLVRLLPVLFGTAVRGRC